MFGKLSLVLVPAIMLGGCFVFPDAKAPKTGAVATGEQLGVVDDIKTWTTTSKEKVGETTYTDANGQTVGHADTYAEKTTQHSMKVWYPVQGAQQLGDEDFFRISGDAASLKATEELHANGAKWNRRGKYTLVGGLVGLVGGYFIPNAPIRAIAMTAGGLAVSGGWYMAYWGAKQMEPETHAVDRSMAERAALQYNQQVGHTAGLSFNKSF